MLRKLFVTLIGCLVASLAVADVHSRRDDVKIQVKHTKTLDVTFIQNGGPTSITNRALTGEAAKDDFDVNHDSDVEVILQNPNPLLYKYEIRNKKTGKTESTQALEQFGSTVDALQAALAKIWQGVPGPAGKTKGILLKAVGTASDCQEAKLVEDTEEIQDAAEFTAKRLTAAKNLIAESLDDPNGVKVTVQTKASFEVSSSTGRSKITKDKKDKDWDVQAHKKEFETAVDNLKSAAADKVKEKKTECAAALLLALANVDKIAEGFAKLEKFKETVNQLNVPISLGTFPVTRTEFTTFDVHVEEIRDNWPADLKDPLFIGDRTIKVSPDERVPVSLQASMIYSFVKASEFGTEEIPAGGEETGFRITQKNKKTTGFDLAAGLEFAPKALDFTSFNAVILLGISPQDHLGIFLGFGIKAAAKFAFGAGIAFHQVDELSGNQTVGGVLAKKDDLKTDKKFKSGPYLFFSYKPK
jgi:hypothetical protein